jgi:hypothetical protein
MPTPHSPDPQFTLRFPVLESRADQIERDAHAFLKRNPDFWDEFCRRAFLIRKRGHKHYSAMVVVQNIRWHTDLGDCKDFKINNNYTPIFARVFNSSYPELNDFFKTREQTSRRSVAR